MQKPVNGAGKREVLDEFVSTTAWASWSRSNYGVSLNARDREHVLTSVHPFSSLDSANRFKSFADHAALMVVHTPSVRPITSTNVDDEWPATNTRGTGTISAATTAVKETR
jgi:hypothetical protein